MYKRERLEEEFELEDEQQTIEEYSNIASVISVNYSLMAGELSNAGDFSKGMAVDLGTGLGDLAIEVASRHPQLQVMGLDISEKAVEEANNKAKQRNLGNVSFRTADVHSLPFEDGSVDLVVSHGVLHHLKDISKVFIEIYRILKPNGLAYIVDLRRDAPEEVVKEVAAHLPPNQAKAFMHSVEGSYLIDELKEILTKAGIRNFEVQGLKFSRVTILKNMSKLRSSSMRKADYTKLSLTIIIRKEQESRKG